MSEAAPLVIAGGGLAGCLAALALAQRRPDVPFLLIEGDERFGGNHIWSFFDGDVADAHRWLVKPLVSSRWPEHEVRFPRRERILTLGYNSIRSADLDAHVRSTLPSGSYLLGREIVEVGPNHVQLADGERIAARGVIDARGPALIQGLDLAWQKFVGRTYRLDRPHGRSRPVIMDARVQQDDGYRFLYTLPFGETELMVEDTYYSTSPILDVPMIRGRIGTYLRHLGLDSAEAAGEETGVLPVLLGGEIDSLWPETGPHIARLGLAGGFFHPTTGYSLADAVRNAALLAEQKDFGSGALHGLFRDRAATLWRDRRFYQRLNRMLFHAAVPRRRYRVLEHFYRLPEPVIARFYADRLTLLDKVRILSGRPPVPVRSAIAALRGKTG